MTTLAAAGSVALPVLKDVRDVLMGLTGSDVTLTAGQPVAGTAARPSYGLLVTDTGALAAVAVLDLALAAGLGAALGLLPPGAAEDAVDEGALTPILQENLYEVVNILSSVYNVPGSAHVRLTTLHVHGEPVPPDAAALAIVIGRRVDVTVALGRYGGGGLSLVARP